MFLKQLTALTSGKLLKDMTDIIVNKNPKDLDHESQKELDDALDCLCDITGCAKICNVSYHSNNLQTSLTENNLIFEVLNDNDTISTNKHSSFCHDQSLISVEIHTLVFDHLFDNYYSQLYRYLYTKTEFECDVLTPLMSASTSLPKNDDKLIVQNIYLLICGGADIHTLSLVDHHAVRPHMQEEIPISMAFGLHMPDVYLALVFNSEGDLHFQSKFDTS